jgi:hypothetical protein
LFAGIIYGIMDKDVYLVGFFVAAVIIGPFIIPKIVIIWIRYCGFENLIKRR